MDAETRRILATAKGIVANGWCQRRLSDGRGRYCMDGAVCAAVGRDERGSLCHPYENAIRELHKAVGANFVTWNDKPGRTQAEVVALFDKVLADNPAPAPDPDFDPTEDELSRYYQPSTYGDAA